MNLIYKNWKFDIKKMRNIEEKQKRKKEQIERNNTDYIKKRKGKMK